MFSETVRQIILDMKAENFNSTQIGKALKVSPDRIRMFFSRLNAETYTGPRIIRKKL